MRSARSCCPRAHSAFCSGEIFFRFFAIVLAVKVAQDVIQFRVRVEEADENRLNVGLLHARSVAARKLVRKMS